MKPLANPVASLAAALTCMVVSLGAYAAESTDRTYADPACSARDANPERCVINDGAPVRLGVEKERVTVPTPSPNTPATLPAAPTSTPTLKRGYK
jgi:hypothetical protein